MPRHEDLDDRLDALLDGHEETVVSYEMAPLLAAASALRASVAPLRLDPATARRHLREALAGSLPSASRPSRFPEAHPATASPTASRASRVSGSEARTHSPQRSLRRLATLALAAALVLVPLVMFAGGALPGNPLYQVKLATEQVHLTALSWSPPRAADLHTKIANARLDELEQLVASGQLDQIPQAIGALDSAVSQAEHAASAPNLNDPSTHSALKQRLGTLQTERVAQLSALLQRLPAATPTAARVRIQDAVRHSLDQR